MDKRPRIATLGDIDALVRLINRAYHVEHFIVTGDRVDAESIRRRMEHGEFHVLDADEPGGDNRLAGAVCIDSVGTRGHFGLLSVDPEYQGRGLGDRLIVHLEALLAERHCTSIDIEVVSLRTEMFPFYENRGYVRTNTAPFPEPEKLKQPAHMVLLSKRLIAPQQR